KLLQVTEFCQKLHTSAKAVKTATSYRVLTKTAYQFKSGQNCYKLPSFDKNCIPVQKRSKLLQVTEFCQKLHTSAKAVKTATSNRVLTKTAYQCKSGQNCYKLPNSYKNCIPVQKLSKLLQVTELKQKREISTKPAKTTTSDQVWKTTENETIEEEQF